MLPHHPPVQGHTCLPPNGALTTVQITHTLSQKFTNHHRLPRIYACNSDIMVDKSNTIYPKVKDKLIVGTSFTYWNLAF